MSKTTKRNSRKGDSVIMRKMPQSRHSTTTSDSESEVPPPHTISPQSFWSTQLPSPVNSANLSTSQVQNPTIPKPSSSSSTTTDTTATATATNCCQGNPKIQLAVAFAMLVIATAFILEPIYSGKIGSDSVPTGYSQKKKPLTFGQRMAYVIMNASYPLLWIVTIEIYNEYLRALEKGNSQQPSVIESRLQATEKLRGRSLSQFVVMFICELQFVFDIKLVPILIRIVPVFNCLYLVGRIVEFMRPNRCPMFSHLISYTPLIICVSVSAFMQSYKILMSTF